MGFKTGIIGLPNVGKSTLFNALTQTAAAQAENFPFCTIEPNIGAVNVPDFRLQQIAEIAKSASVIPARMTFVDIAGLVSGASKGEGLGNQFLANIRECDAIAHVLRCFENTDITHVEGTINPLHDADVVETELMLADLASIEKQRIGLMRKLKGGDKQAQLQDKLLSQAEAILSDGKPARLVEIATDEKRAWRALRLLSAKPVLYVCNVSEEHCVCGNKLSAQIQTRAREEGSVSVIISAAIEAEISQLETDDATFFLKEIGLEEPGLNRLIREGYKLLDLITYFTAGTKEARAWTISNGTSAPKAAGVIHEDFERSFIRAETISITDYIACGGEQGAKEQGKMRAEGKGYLVKDGDILHILHGA